MNSVAIQSEKVSGQKIQVRGIVQGVGFRPTVWKIAHQLNLPGKVYNNGDGLLIEVYGKHHKIEQFIDLMKQQCPPLARIDAIDCFTLNTPAPTDFSIVSSQPSDIHTSITPDAATCCDCLKDIFNSSERRHQYAFTNCTHCGPRLSIIKAMPYDRQNTSMSDFTLCPSCQTEYNNPNDRRFHAQPNACPTCGPKIWIEPHTAQNHLSTITQAQQLLRDGAILAIKGIGGFHLACDATNLKTVKKLRQRKNRYAKPFALMAKNIESITPYCFINTQEKELLESAKAPIVLLNKKNYVQDNPLASPIAAHQNTLGFMLPYTPLHHLLLKDIHFPLVMTSGNPSDVPQSIENSEARERLEGIADYWLLNDRDIINRLDDSVVRVIAHKPRVLRRSRGYAPSTFPLPKGFENSPDVLACGGELKNTFCLVKDQQMILSQHIGDLKNAATYEDYEKKISLYQQLYQHQPNAVIIDTHPDYLSGEYGRQHSEQQQIPLIEVQHHHAHIAACLGDNQWPLNGGKVLGIALDGLGYGNDGTLWGGEFLLTDYQTCQRVAHFSALPLLGGVQAMHQPWRNTYVQLLSHFSWEGLIQQFGDLELVHFLKQKPTKTLDAMLAKGIHTPLSSSCGRLFDAVAAALGICREQIQYEAQTAIELEQLVSYPLIEQEKEQAYSLTIVGEKQLNINAIKLWESLLNDLKNKTHKKIIATRFHLGLANVIVKMVLQLKEQNTLKTVNTIALSGGVFQNRFLFELVNQQLIDHHYTVLSHTQIPANDAGISVGQALVALAQYIQKQEVNLCA